MTLSLEYQCNRCETYLDIIVSYEVDAKDGEGVYVVARCPQCGDQRVGEVDPLGRAVRSIAKKVGT